MRWRLLALACVAVPLVSMAAGPAADSRSPSAARSATVTADALTDGQRILDSAAKAAVISLAKGLSLDLLSRRIRVNSISPGSIDTPVFGKMVPQDLVDQVKQIYIDLTPLGRQGSPAEIGKTAVFLASDDSSFIVGVDILADGGMANTWTIK